MEIEHLKAMRLKCGLSLTDVAKVLEIDRSNLGKIEKGKRYVSNEMKEKLISFYQRRLDSLSFNDDLEAKFDWCRVRLNEKDWKKVAGNVLCIDPDMFFYKHTGKYGYIASYSFGDIQVLDSKEGDDRGVLIEMSGRACRQYEEILDTMNQNWKDFFRRCKAYKDYNFGRLDCALDDKKEFVSIPELIKKCDQGLVKTKFRVIRSINEQQVSDSKETGATLYFGSRKGSIHFAFYQKNYEQAIKKKVSVDEIDVKNRYEIRLMNQKANVFVDEYLANYDCSLLIRSVIEKYVTFFDYNRRTKEATISKDWLELIKNTIDIDFRMDPVQYSFEKSYNWMNYQGGKVLKKLQLYSNFVGEDLIAKIISNAELTEEDEKQVEQATTESDNVIFLKNDKVMNIETGELFISHI